MDNTIIKRFINEFIIISSVFTVLAIAFGHSIWGYFNTPDQDVVAKMSDDKITVVIDPGHGGEDGGAVALDGTVEKDLNLEFGKTLNLICNVLGLDSVMTRETDTLLYDKYSDLSDYTGKKKVFDLKNRLRFTNESGDNPIFVSIHMNKFQGHQYSGTHVYYSPNNALSKDLASGVQNIIKTTLQPQNNRTVKKAGSSIFLLWRMQIPAILIECGFLSNESETDLLKKGEYKKEFSLATAVAIGEFASQ